MYESYQVYIDMSKYLYYCYTYAHMYTEFEKATLDQLKAIGKG